MRRVATLVLCAVVAAPTARAMELTPRQLKQEQRLLYQSAELDELLERADVLVDDAPLTAYVSSVVAKLFPEEKDSFVVRLHRDSSTNAFMLPNGSLYVNVGMLARLTDESQLAMVLAHEGEHYLQRHGVRSIMSAKTNSAVGSVLGLAIGAPALGAMLAGSSYAGFSKDLEREADRLGFERLVAAGYAVAAAAIPFERMAAEAKAAERGEGGGFFGSHPRLTERVESLSALARRAPDAAGETGADRYLAATGAARLDAIADQLRRRRFKQLAVLLTDDAVLATYPPEARYYLAEALRARRDDGDADRAAEQFRRVTEEAPMFAPGWRGLGLFHLREGNNAAALAALERFLMLAPDAEDRAFIERYVERIRMQGAES